MKLKIFLSLKYNHVHVYIHQENNVSVHRKQEQHIPFYTQSRFTLDGYAKLSPTYVHTANMHVYKSAKMAVSTAAVMSPQT